MDLQNITLQFNHCPNDCSADEQTARVTRAVELNDTVVGHWFNARAGRAPLDDSKVFYCPPRPITIVQSFFLSHLQLLKDIQAVHWEFKTFTHTSAVGEAPNKQTNSRRTRDRQLIHFCPLCWLYSVSHVLLNSGHLCLKLKSIFM